jgi:cytosine/adenosine deaminase-related metal-dependent hydrolase
MLPIDHPPIENAWIEVANGRIVAFGRGRARSAPRDLGDVAVLPGLVNAHTHLELSWLEGRVPPAASLVEWIRALIRERAASGPNGEPERLEAMQRAAAAMRAAGTVLVGDISNTLTSVPAIASADLGGVVFHELLGFQITDAAAFVREGWARADATAAAASNPDLFFSVVAHAPYSTSPALIGEIARRRRNVPLAIHLGESPEEVEFLRGGGGPFVDLLVDLGVWNPEWHAPDCDPVEYLARLGSLQPGLLAVHAVQLTDEALGRLADAGGLVVTCPRSNAWVGVGLPRVAHFYAAGVPVAIGTDSLASSPSLSVFDELAELRRIAPDVNAASLLDSATRQGARALGFDAEYGTIAAGKRAALISVDLPAGGVTDVEEYLVSGVPPSAVRHLA